MMHLLRAVSLRAALLPAALVLTPACAPEPEDLHLKVERSGDALLLNWVGGNVHRLDIVECEAASEADLEASKSCGCTGTVVWSLGPSDEEPMHEVSRGEAFLSAPIEYGVTPATDRKAYAARPLKAGKFYVANIHRFEPCEDNRLNCAQSVAEGCARFTW
ncbi:hypothetical protein F0U61_10135 [Archangium violaceum]|uniref:hypothetical protein n=1 Tax=Archangium violaceum TaxID=83451 RepID=UPI002B2A39C4|nr:hypothetical protein F0U61_10135 [Archangium violaceum]